VPPLDDPWEAYLYLASLPGVPRPPAGRLINAFRSAAARVAAAFLADPSEHNLLSFLALPKVALSPTAARQYNVTLTHRLHDFPHVPWPSPTRRQSSSTPRAAPPAATLANALLRNGKTRAAIRCLTENLTPRPPDDAVLASLLDLHPPGPRVPFFSLRHPAPLTITKDVTDALIVREARKFPFDCNGGPSGWTPHLLNIALENPDVVQFVHLLTALVISESAPGQRLLTASILTPVPKASGKIRPITSGELLYRLVAKIIIAVTDCRALLLPQQFGVKTPGGVEPIIRLIEQATHDPAHASSVLYSLDFSNAYNTIDRSFLADAVHRFAPRLTRPIRWVYGSQSPLLIPRSSGGMSLISSAQGVRQGDPLGPLLFSLGMRPIVQALVDRLGPRYSVMAYLDDLLILGPPLPADFSFAELLPYESGLHFNADKSSVRSIADINLHGLDILGAHIGPSHARANFLSGKVSAMIDKLKKLEVLPRHSMLVLLSRSVQHDLRHVARTTRTDDLCHIWQSLDSAIADSAAHLAAAQPEPLQSPTTQLTFLPVCLGGLGLTSYCATAPLAHAAAMEAADAYLGLTPPDSPLPLSQRQRTQEFNEQVLNSLLQSIPASEAILVVENSSPANRRWLSTLPTSAALSLSDHEVACELRSRTLRLHAPPCPRCGRPSDLQHAHSVCDRSYTTLRHHTLRNSIADAIRSIGNDITVSTEPAVGGHRRNDIRVSGVPHLGITPCDFEIKTTSLNSLVPRPSDSTSRASVSKLIEARLQTVYDLAVANIPRHTDGVPTPPCSVLVFSALGSFHSSSVRWLHAWRKHIRPSALQHAIRSISFRLLRLRAKAMRL